MMRSTGVMKEEDVIQAVKDKDVMFAAKEDAEPRTILVLLEYLSAMGMVWKFICLKYEKPFSKNVWGCRDGSAKNHTN